MDNCNSVACEVIDYILNNVEVDVAIKSSQSDECTQTELNIDEDLHGIDLIEENLLDIEKQESQSTPNYSQIINKNEEQYDVQLKCTSDAWTQTIIEDINIPLTRGPEVPVQAYKKIKLMETEEVLEDQVVPNHPADVDCGLKLTFLTSTRKLGLSKYFGTTKRQAH